jgi:hypothetical protein
MFNYSTIYMIYKKTPTKHLKKNILLFMLVFLFIVIHSTEAATSLLYPEINKQSLGVEGYAINIFCTEIVNKKYLKVTSGSGSFLSDPNEQKSVILTNAHVARHLLDKNKNCVGRTGSPAVTTHKLTLRYIPSFWLQSNGSYIIGDPNKNSTGEFDFAIIETQKISKTTSKNKNLYNIFYPKLNLQLQDYTNGLSQGSILSYPAQKTLSKNVYNPLYLKKDTISISDIYKSPTYQEPDSLLDTKGSTYIDHGSSGGMVLLQNTNNNLIGISSILIQENYPQIVRVVTLSHVFSVIEKDLSIINTDQSGVFTELIKNAQKQKSFDESYANIFKNSKLTSLLELQTRKTLLNLGIPTK